MNEMSDEEGERMIARDKAAILQALRELYAETDDGNFEAVALTLSAFAGQLITNLAAIMGDREGIVVMNRATDENVQAAAACMWSLFASIMQIINARREE